MASQASRGLMFELFFFYFRPSLSSSSSTRSHFLAGTSSEQITTADCWAGFVRDTEGKCAAAGRVRCGDLGEFILESVRASLQQTHLEAAEARRRGHSSFTLSHHISHSHARTETGSGGFKCSSSLAVNVDKPLSRHTVSGISSAGGNVKVQQPQLLKSRGNLLASSGIRLPLFHTVDAS